MYAMQILCKRKLIKCYEYQNKVKSFVKVTFHNDKSFDILRIYSNSKF